MKKLFTLIALAMSFVGGYAQSHEWNFSDWTQTSIASTTTIDGLTVYAVAKAIALDNNNKTVDNVKYTRRLKLGGKGAVSSLAALDKVVSFEIEGPAVISVVAISSKSTEARDLVFSYTSKEATETAPVEFQVVNFDGSAAKKVDVEYTGGAGNIYIYGKDNALNIYYIKVISTLTTAKSSFSTYAASYPVDYTSLGLDAYAITLDEANMKVKYNKIDGVVPANTPVLVKGEASKTYSLTKATTDGTSVATDLQVSDGTITGDGSTIYAFGTKNGVSGFKVVASGVKIPAKKGYLKLSSSAAAKDFFAFGGETTGISNVSANGIDEEETPLFNLAGQRVDKSYKGVVVKNGKKFVNK